MLVAPLAAAARSHAPARREMSPCPFSAPRGSPLALASRLPPGSEMDAGTDRGSPGAGRLPEGAPPRRSLPFPAAMGKPRLGRGRWEGRGRSLACQKEPFGEAAVVQRFASLPFVGKRVINGIWEVSAPLPRTLRTSSSDIDWAALQLRLGSWRLSLQNKSRHASVRLF